MANGPSIRYHSHSRENWWSCRRIDGLALQHKSHCSLRTSVFHGQIRGCFKTGLPVLEAFGLVVTIATMAHSLQLELPASLWPGVQVHGFFCWLPILLAAKFEQSLSSPDFPLKIAIPSLFVCFLWWLILALWDRYFLIFPNIVSKSLPRGWLISLYQLSKVTRLRDDTWRKLVIRLEIWSLQLRCFCNAS